jgi:hypothetical protein
MAIDMFGLDETQRVNNKWSIKNFASGFGGSFGKQGTNNSSIPSNDNIEFSKAMGAFSRTDAEIQSQLDKLYKEMTLKRKEINRDLSEMKATAKGEVIAMLHKTDIDIINSQLHIVESKLRAKNDRYKNERDERKFYFVEKNKGAASEAPVQIGINNSPMSVGSATSTAPTSIIRATPTTTATETIATVPEKVNVNVIEDSMGVANVTLDQVQTKNANTLNARLQKVFSEEDSNNVVTSQEINYGTSMKALTKRDSEDVLFVDKSSGKFYFRSYITDDNGNRVENPDYIPPGVLSIRKGLRFDNGSHKAMSKFLGDGVLFPYRLVQDLDDMPDFYRSEWAHPKTERCVLEEETLARL